eukprot:1491966-Rhodomonas_salina.1
MWTKVHNQIQKLWGDTAFLADVTTDADSSSLPRPPDSKKQADIVFQLRLPHPTTTSEYRVIVGYAASSLTHQYVGDADDRSTWGTYKTDHMQRRINDKNSKYQQFHYQLNYLFLPLVCNTFGLINCEALGLLFLFAHKAATLYFDAISEQIYDDDCKFRAAFLHHQSSLFNRFKSLITLAACRGMARRGDLTSVHHDIGMEYQHFDDDDGP